MATKECIKRVSAKKRASALKKRSAKKSAKK